MSNHVENKTDYSPYFIIAIIAGALTFWVGSGSILWTLIGAGIFLFAATIFVHVLAPYSESDRD